MSANALAVAVAAGVEVEERPWLPNLIELDGIDIQFQTAITPPRALFLVIQALCTSTCARLALPEPATAGKD